MNAAHSGSKGALGPLEVADAAVLGGVSLVLCLIGFFVPHATAVTALGSVPMALVAYRHRARAVVNAAVAGSAVGFLVAGTGPVSGIVVCAVIGGLVGWAQRRGWGPAPTVAIVAFLIGPLFGAAADGLLSIFAASRRLTLDQLQNSWTGTASILRHVPVVRDALPDIDRAVHDALRAWWLTIPIVIEVLVVLATVGVWWITRSICQRLAGIGAGDLLEPRGTAGDPDALPVPVPVTLCDVHYRYPGAPAEAVAGVSLSVESGSFVAVVGPNGSGKSTLVRLLAGMAPTSGTILRPGSPGLGRVGGTALIMQRPEAQVLGVRVADDVRWGLPPDHPVDVGALLATVGLEGMESRDTVTLSGGELQRLAVAAALARRPRLLLSDESTAMVDAGGRRQLVELLAALPATGGLSVVHVTHRPEEAARAGTLITMRAGRRLPEGGAGDDHGTPDHHRPGTAAGLDAPDHHGHAGNGTTAGLDAAPRPLDRLGPPSGGRSLRLRGVGHVWAEGTPWAQQALTGVDLGVEPGDGLLVVGGNGSGKSTLAWILAGLVRPAAGSCELGGRPVSEQVGRVGLAFQHARLQLQRRNVLADVRAAGGVDGDVAAAALATVGFDPDTIARRDIDQLSGGQLRRVAIAGLIARRPDVLVLDEPLAGLDESSRQLVLAALATLRREQGLTVVMISHDLEGAESLCDRILRLDRGRVVEDQPLVASPC